jgi:hypothetical protein
MIGTKVYDEWGEGIILDTDPARGAIYVQWEDGSRKWVSLSRVNLASLGG